MPLRTEREAAGLSQAELAESAGVSRQLVSSAESGRSVPAVDAALRMAAVLGVTVERLFDAPPALDTAVVGSVTVGEGTRVHVGRVGHRLIAWPVEENGIACWWPTVDGFFADGELQLFPGVQPDGLVVAGCDPALGIAETLLLPLGQRRLVGFSISTGDALKALGAGLCHGALVHGPDHALPRPPIPVRRFRLARWQVGIGTHPRVRERSVEALVDRGVPIAQRDPGATTQQAFVRALAAAGLKSADGPRSSGHFDAARRAAVGRAASVTFEPAALAFDLSFEPLETHVVELWLAERHLDHAGVAPLGELLVSPRFQRQVALLGPYDLSDCGAEVSAATRS
jgi:transcriptional regulator with XRE-family HTH domain